jgi:hypothetical protein
MSTETKIEKIAANTELTDDSCRRIAGYTLGGTLTSPAVNLSKEAAKHVTTVFLANLKKADERFAARQPKLVDMLKAHVNAPASA